MKKSIIYPIVILVIIIAPAGWAQEIAVTEKGDSVILFNNGTWDYYENFDNHTEDKTEIRLNPAVFTKPKTSGQKINGDNQAFELWYNDKIWKRMPAGNINPNADVALQMIKGDVYSMVIYEELQIPVENLTQIALTNAIKAAPDIKKVDQEYRIVNNDTLICMQMDGTANGIKITYYSYYFSNDKGSIQFLTFTGQNLFGRYKDEMEQLLNGLVINEFK